MRCPGCRALVAPSDVVCVCGFPLRFHIEGTPLNLGIVRDQAGDRRNDYAMFFEEWLFVTGLDSPRSILDISP